MNQMEVKRKRYTAVSNLILVINILVLSSVLGEHGMGYLSGALECFFLLSIITVYTLPEAMAKLIRVRMQKGQGRNAMKVMRAAIFVGIGDVVIGTLFLGIFPEMILGKLLENTYGAFTMRMFIPAYIILVFVQILRGFFQGMGSTVPTGISKIVAKAVLFGAGILFCTMFVKYGENVSALLKNKEFTTSFASAGVAAGYAVAELFALLFLFFVYQTNRRRLRTGENKDNFRVSERMSEIVYILIMTILPLAFCMFLQRVMVLAGIAIYQHSTSVAVEVGIGVCGAFYGKYLPVILLCVMMIRCVCASYEGQIHALYRKDEVRLGREKISWGVHQIVMIGTFLAVFVAVMGETLMGAFYKGDSGQAGDMLQLGSSMILFMGLAIFFMEILLAQGRIRSVIVNMFIGVIAFLLWSGIGTFVLHGGIDVIVVAHCVFWFILTCCNGFLCIRFLKWSPEWIYLLAIPVGCSALMGIIVMLLNKALVSLTGEWISCLICLLVGVIGNFVLLLALRGIRREELEAGAGGRILCKFAEIIHLL